MNKLFASVLLILLGLSSVQAGIIAQYNVQNYNNGAAAHGLYTFTDFSPNTFTIDALFTLSEELGIKTATLDGTVTNVNHSGTINLVLENWMDNFNYKVEQGADNGGINADFFVDISGIINIDGTDYDISNCGQCNYAFQYGVGANAKNETELGASAWIQNGTQTDTTHWDLNLSFTEVPEPATIMLMGLGLLGLRFGRRK